MQNLLQNSILQRILNTFSNMNNINHEDTICSIITGGGYVFLTL